MNEGCHVEPLRKIPAPEERENTTTALLAILGMGCENCVARVRNSLLSVYGVVAVDIDLALGAAEVVFNPRLTDVGEIKQAVERAGGDGRHEYRAQLISGEVLRHGTHARLPS